MLLSLLNLYFQTRKRFWTLDVEVYGDAMSELNRLANLVGYSPNDIAKILITGKED